jgi:phosphatidylglycerophosphate synthase
MASDIGDHVGAAAPETRMQRYAEAMSALVSRQKTNKGAPAYSRFVNRRLGRHLAAAAWALDRTPNQVTAVSASFSAAGILTLALVRPTVLSAVAVTLALVVGYALDSADGQLARLRGGGSSVGEWLDHVVDAVKAGSLHAAVLVSLYRFSDLSDLWLLIPLLYLVVATSWFFAVVLTDLLRRAHRARTGASPAPTSQAAPVWRSILALPTDYGLLCLVFLLLASPRTFAVVYGLMFAGSVVLFVASLHSWFRELSAHVTPG